MFDGFSLKVDENKLLEGNKKQLQTTKVVNKFTDYKQHIHRVK